MSPPALRTIVCWMLFVAIALSGRLFGEDSKHVHRRSDFANARLKFETKKTGRVAFIGGSITEMNGYRPMVQTWLQERFPETKFKFTDAGISSTCSTTGAFRLRRDVLSQGPVDLFFIEFAVNDDQDASHTRDECIRAMEGIVRQTRSDHPFAELVFTYFVNPEMLAQIQKGEMPLPMEAHEAVAEHYGVSTILLAHEVADRIQAGTLTWEVYGGTHPKPAGNKIAAELIAQCLTDGWSGAKQEKHEYTLPEPLDPFHYGAGRFLDPDAKAKGSWTFQTPDWKSLPGSCRARFEKMKLHCADTPGDELAFAFSGKAIGAYVLAGPDAGKLEVSIDGGEYETFDLYHRFSKGLHYPRTVMFADQLEGGDHILRLRISEEKNPASKGTAARILHFTGN